MLSRADNTETGTLYPHRSSRDFRFLGIESNDMAGHLAVPRHAGEDVKELTRKLWRVSDSRL